MSMRQLLWPLLLLSALTLGACQGCRNDAKPPGSHGSAEPALRLYLLSTVAGALEPCGCSKDQTGGLDHLAAFIRANESKVPHSVLLSAGPLLYIDAKLKDDHATQDRWKAETIAMVMKDLSLTAWAPGFNDWADGTASLRKQASQSGAALVGTGLQGVDDITATKRMTVNNVDIGIVGVSDPRDRMGGYPDGVTPLDAAQVVAHVKREVDGLKEQGAELLVVLAAAQRGAALRIADAIPDLNVLVVGKTSSEGHGNTAQPPAEMIGSTLVVETANHAQTVSLVDVYLRGEPTTLLELADAGGVKKAAQVGALSRRINELEARINSWEKGGEVDPADLSARKAELEKLRAERESMDKDAPPPAGDFFRYRVVEVREEFGADTRVSELMGAYYKRVNEHNKSAFADMKPLPAEGDQASYVGVDSCTDCHMQAREVWDATPHAKAYATLEEGSKEFNLECVNCHVTGYGKPGGSTVTHVATLKDVQCETCHGPGSKHIADPEAPDLIVLKPDPQSCVEQCHHPPHVEGFDPVSKMHLVLGPGHGK